MRKYIILTLCLLLTLSLAACDSGETGPHEHKFVSRKVIPASCAAEGEKMYLCECGEQYTETSPQLDHTYGDWEIVVKPTMNAAGKSARECSGCGNKEEMVLEALTIEEEITTYTGILLQMPQFTDVSELSSDVMFNWVLLNAEIVSSGFNNETFKATRVYYYDGLLQMTKHYFGKVFDYEAVFLGNDNFVYKEYDDTLTWILDAAGGWPTYNAEAITKIDETHYTLRYSATDLGETTPYMYGVLTLELVDGRFVIQSHVTE